MGGNPGGDGGGGHDFAGGGHNIKCPPSPRFCTRTFFRPKNTIFNKFGSFSDTTYAPPTIAPKNVTNAPRQMLRDICSGDICSGDNCSADNCSADNCSADNCSGENCSADNCSGDRCSEDTTIAPPIFAPRQLLGRHTPVTPVAPVTLAPVTTAPATYFQELLRGYATFAPPIITLKICDISSADDCQLSREG